MRFLPSDAFQVLSYLLHAPSTNASFSKNNRSLLTRCWRAKGAHCFIFINGLFFVCRQTIFVVEIPQFCCQWYMGFSFGFFVCFWVWAQNINKSTMRLRNLMLILCQLCYFTIRTMHMNQWPALKFWIWKLPFLVNFELTPQFYTTGVLHQWCTLAKPFNYY